MIFSGRKINKPSRQIDQLDLDLARKSNSREKVRSKFHPPSGQGRRPDRTGVGS